MLDKDKSSSSNRRDKDCRMKTIHLHPMKTDIEERRSFDLEDSGKLANDQSEDVIEEGEK